MITIETTLLVMLAAMFLAGAVLAFFYHQDRKRKKSSRRRLRSRLNSVQEENLALKGEVAALREAWEADRTKGEAAVKKADQLTFASNFAVRCWLEQMHPPLAALDTPDIEKAQWLREWVHLHVPAVQNHSSSLDAQGHYEVYKWPVAIILAELARTGKGFLCGGTSIVLRKLYDLFSLPACTYNMGGATAGCATHVVTLVSVRQAGQEIWTVQDAFFNRTLKTTTDEPADLRALLRRLAYAHTAGFRMCGEALPRPLVLKATQGLDAGRLMQDGAAWLGQVEGYLQVRTVQSWEDWMSQVAQDMRWLKQDSGHDHSFFFFLYPLNIDGDARFQSLAQMALQTRSSLYAARKPLCIVYAKGKTGTQTMEQTLRTADWQGRIARTHFLARASIRRKFKLKSESAFLPTIHKQTTEARELRAMYRQQVRMRKNGIDVPRAKIVSAVREPIGRLLAAFFQGYTRFFDGQEAPKTVPEIRAYILNKFYKIRKGELTDGVLRGNFDASISWFHEEVEQVLRVNVFSVPFDTARGWQIYAAPDADLLVIRQENFSVLTDVFAQFFSIPNPSLTNANIGAEKPYAALYQACKEELKFPAEFVDAWYNAPAVRHFYTTQELDAFRARWVE